jgi:hypothetical protein
MHISMATLLYNVEKNAWIEYEFDSNKKKMNFIKFMVELKVYII